MLMYDCMYLYTRHKMPKYTHHFNALFNKNNKNKL